MQRLMGIDYGKKRTGLAVSDPLGIFSSPLETVETAKVVEYIRSYMQKEPVEKFVLGLPFNLDGTPSESEPGVRQLAATLSRQFPTVEIVYEDERFTSTLAHRAMIDGGMKASRRRDKAEVDRISASIILQSYLDRSAHSASSGTVSTSSGTFSASSGTGAFIDPDSVPESRSRKNTRRK